MTISHAWNLRERFVAIGVSKSLAGQLSRQVSQWVKDSGPEWAVNRLKLLKTAFLRRIAGESYQLPYVAKRMDAFGMLPKGPFGVLWKDVNMQSSLSVSRALNAMMVYSAIIADAVSPAQWEKFHKSMTRSDPSEENLRMVVGQLKIPKWMRVDQTIELEPVEQFVVRHGYSPDYVSDAIEQFVESDTGMALWEEFPQYKLAMSSLSGPIDSRIGWDDMFAYHPKLDSRYTADPVGKLGCTQEPGFKLRVFANPNIVHQLAMSRLKRQLFTLLQRVRWDCTYDQDSGTSWVQRKLAQGRKCYSIDLSDATNNFPLQVQLSILRSIGCRSKDVELFHRLARAPWISTHEKPKPYRWTVGQPLGLGPSFAAFALTHGLLVWSIARACRVTDCFRVLGDDIVITEEQVATKYLEAMQLLGVPISRDKTIVSSDLAEFAGKVVTPEKILAGLKWRHPSDRSFIEVVRLLGPSSVSLLTERQKRIINFLSVLPEPTGFGWNPNGIPFAKRASLAEAFEALTPEEERTYHPLQRKWNRIYRSLKQPYFELRFHSNEWDPVIGEASRTTSREPTPVGSGRHLLSISEMTGSPLKLPLSEITPSFERELKRVGFISLASVSDPRGLTTLEIMERKIAKLRFNMEHSALMG